MPFVRVAVAVLGTLFALGFAQARSCGYEPDPLKGEGEPCTRTDECQSSLECRGGVCMTRTFDAGPGFDAGRDEDAGSDDGGADAGDDAGAVEDASVDASTEDSGA